jgi:hypothetical protein
MTQEEVARVAHEVNRAYCQSLGDNSQLKWEEAPEWQRSSAIAGVSFHVVHPDAGPEASHESWLALKKIEGWSYGKKKNPEKKTHPCYLPFKKLPKEQQAKDYIFWAVVHALLF